MTIGERIRELRAESGMSQTAYGAYIGTSRDAVANVECGRTDPGELLINYICSKHNVNRDWLISGVEPKRTESDAAEIERLSTQYNLTPIARRAMEIFAGLPPEMQEAALRTIVEIVDGIRDTPESLEDAIDAENEQVEVAQKLKHA